MTIILTVAHAFSKNPDFQPIGLYLGTFLLDAAIIKGLLGVTI